MFKYGIFKDLIFQTQNDTSSTRPVDNSQKMTQVSKPIIQSAPLRRLLGWKKLYGKTYQKFATQTAIDISGNYTFVLILLAILRKNVGFQL